MQVAQHILSIIPNKKYSSAVWKHVFRNHDMSLVFLKELHILHSQVSTHQQEIITKWIDNLDAYNIIGICRPLCISILTQDS